MDFIRDDILSGELVPVILGYSRETVETARRIYSQYHVVSHVFCERIPLPLRLSLCMKFHTVLHASGERLMVEALKDFSRQHSHADIICYLIPCTEAYANLVWNHKHELESRFVIADKAEMHRVWFGEEIKKEERI